MFHVLFRIFFFFSVRVSLSVGSTLAFPPPPFPSLLLLPMDSLVVFIGPPVLVCVFMAAAPVDPEPH